MTNERNAVNRKATRATTNTGFTLVELMVVILIAAILLGIAVPSFDSLIKKNNVEALQSKLASAIATARSEAASRNVIVSLCPSTNGTACATGTTPPVSSQWGSGWLVFENADGLIGTDDTTAVNDQNVIDSYNNSGSYTIETSSAESFTFSPQGFLTSGASADTFIICPDSDENKYARGLHITQSGLVVKTKDTNDDGIHNKPGTSGANIDCANI